VNFHLSQPNIAGNSIAIIIVAQFFLEIILISLLFLQSFRWTSNLVTVQ